MNTIKTKMEMIDLLKSIKGATIVGLTTKTEVRMRKSGNPLASSKVEKLTSKTCQFGYSYENAVNNRLDKIGSDNEFKAKRLKYGKWLIPNKVITHKGKFYARFYTMENAGCSTIFFVNGKVANPKEISVIEEFAYESGESKRQSENGLSEHQVKPMNYEFGAILSMRVNGSEYSVEIAEVGAEVCA